MTRWAWLAAMACMACGPGLQRRTVTELRDGAVDALLAATAAHDARRVEALFDDQIVFGGAWFPDPACRRKFVVAGVVPASWRPDLARCLATLPLARGARHHQFPEVAVVQYAPGIELEVQFTGAQRVHWIGYVSRASQRDALPTVTPTALFARIRGTRALDAAARARLDAAVTAVEVGQDDQRQARVMTWVKVCVDASGAVSGVHPRATNSLDGQDVFVEAAKRWRFDPFVLGGQVIPVCSVLTLAYPELEPSQQPSLPAFLSPTPGEDPVQLMVPNARHRLAGDLFIRPSRDTAHWLLRHRISRVNVMLKYCVDPTGAVDTVSVLVPTMAPGYDERLVQAVRGWRFTPTLHHGQPVRTCSIVQFVYTQR